MGYGVKKSVADRYELARCVVRQAGDLLRQNLGRIRRVSFKGRINLVTDMDRRSERLIVRTIRRSFPADLILAEESLSDSPLGEGEEFTWVIDPLDGTTNYAHGYPVFCVSVAVLQGTKTVCGLVYDPILDELFTAIGNGPAKLNGRPIRVTAESRLSRSLLATGFPYDVREDPDNNLNHFGRFLMTAQAIRRAGSAALDLCYVAAGIFDGFWELKLSPWDVAAGAFIVTRAGGRVTDFSGAAHDIFKRQIVASNGKIHRQMLRVINAGEGNRNARPPRKGGRA